MNLRATADIRLMITSKHYNEILRFRGDSVINIKSDKSLTVML
jgi:hypothetical protein